MLCGEHPAERKDIKKTGPGENVWRTSCRAKILLEKHARRKCVENILPDENISRTQRQEKGAENILPDENTAYEDECDPLTRTK